MKTSIERRYLPTEFNSRVENRGGSDRLVIEGYAYRFHKRSQNLGGFVEQVLPGAGAESVTTDDVRALFNHDSSLILGRNIAGTLRLGEDSEGLPYEIDADMRQSYVADLAISLERGDVNQSSFGFKAIETDWSLTEDDFPLRSLVKMAIFDVSPVTYPAYTSSSSGLGNRAVSEFYESRGLSPDEISLVEAIRSKSSEPLPSYDFVNEDALYAERHIFLSKNGG